MKTLNEYTIYCTESQTRKALELGAAVIELPFSITMPQNTCDKYGLLYLIDKYYQIPTAEQMVGWLEEQGFEFYTYKPINKWVIDISSDDFCLMIDECNSRQEATLAAIDAALDYLMKKEE